MNSRYVYLDPCQLHCMGQLRCWILIKRFIQSKSLNFIKNVNWFVVKDLDF